MAKFIVESSKAEEFINHEEILDSLKFAVEKAEDAEYVREILEKAKTLKGLSHREAAVLLKNRNKELDEELFSLAREVKRKLYGRRIVLFAPLYLSNYCINGCVYCPYHAKNKTIPRRKLTQEEIKKETQALQDIGHKRIVIEAGEDPYNNPLEYILESIKTIYSVHHLNGDTRRVNVNIAATSVENYRKLKEAGIGTYILFQETYNRKSYEELHPTGPKSDYEYHTTAMDRAMEGGIDDVGIGVLFGLDNFDYELVGLLMHAEHLEAKYGVGPHTISVPRVRNADDIDSESFNTSLNDYMFMKLVAIIRLSAPYTGMIISTRESRELREKVLDLGISQISGGSKTSVGGYSEEIDSRDSEQFEIEDDRPLSEIVEWLIDLGHIPSFCTACYREGRTGDRFMSLVKTGQIANICQPNALMTLEEYLMDYADENVRKKGEAIIDEEIAYIKNETIRNKTRENLENIRKGKRDFRF